MTFKSHENIYQQNCGWPRSNEKFTLDATCISKPLTILLDTFVFYLIMYFLLGCFCVFNLFNVSLQRAVLARSQSSAARQEDVSRCPGTATMKKIALMVQTRSPARAVSINLNYLHLSDNYKQLNE